MRVEHLRLIRFRNLCDQDVSFGKNCTLIVGENAQGKTSLLEAVFLLSQGKSFRSSRPRDLVRWLEAGEEKRDSTEVGCVVDGKVITDDGEKSISYEIVQGRRQISINGKRVSSASAFYGQLCAICFTPDDLKLVKGPPLARRQLLDQILAMTDPHYVDSLVRYQRALKNRNALLLSASKSNQGSALGIDSEIEVWNEQLIEHGSLVAQRRCALVQHIGPHFEHHYQELSKRESAHLEFSSHFLEGSSPREEEDLRRLYSQVLREDMRQRKTTIGPQCDELPISIGGSGSLHPARKAASQGQARSIALALKIAALEYLRECSDEPPVLLLDDVESELDVQRRGSLFALISNLRSQVIVTATEVLPSLKERFSSLQVLEIRQGRIYSE